MTTHYNHRLPTRSNTDVLDADTDSLFNELDILLAVLGQLFPSCHLFNALLPPWHGDVFDFDLANSFQIRWETFDLFSFQLVRYTNFQLVQLIEHIEFRKIE